MALRERYPICPICSTPVELASATADEYGHQLHDERFMKSVTMPLTSNAPLRQSVKEFLAEASTARLRERCEKCGSILYHFVFTFTFGDLESWDVALPVCLGCNSQRLAA
jgi:hypothetical protein